MAKETNPVNINTLIDGVKEANDWWNIVDKLCTKIDALRETEVQSLEERRTPANFLCKAVSYPTGWKPFGLGENITQEQYSVDLKYFGFKDTLGKLNTECANNEQRKSLVRQHPEIKNILRSALLQYNRERSKKRVDMGEGASASEPADADAIANLGLKHPEAVLRVINDYEKQKKDELRRINEELEQGRAARPQKPVQGGGIGGR